MGVGGQLGRHLGLSQTTELPLAATPLTSVAAPGKKAKDFHCSYPEFSSFSRISAFLFLKVIFIDF